VLIPKKDEGWVRRLMLLGWAIMSIHYARIMPLQIRTVVPQLCSLGVVMPKLCHNIYGRMMHTFASTNHQWARSMRVQLYW
jgi:hypothetical protein